VHEIFKLAKEELECEKCREECVRKRPKEWCCGCWSKLDSSELHTWIRLALGATWTPYNYKDEQKEVQGG